MTQIREEAVIGVERNVKGLLRRYKISRSVFWEWRKELEFNTGLGRKYFTPAEVQTLDLFYLFTKRFKIPRSEWFTNIYDLDDKRTLLERFEAYLLSQGVSKQQLINITGDFYGNHS